MIRLTRAVPLTVFLALSLAPALARVVYVNPAAGGPTHDGSSWSTAFTTIPSNLRSGFPPDQVWVAAGTYYGNFNVRTSLYGGFAGTETTRSQRDPVANRTIVDGRSNGTVLSVQDIAIGLTVTIDGFTIQHARSVSVNDFGLAIFQAKAIISNNVFIENEGYADASGGMVGGAIQGQNATITVRNNVITDNQVGVSGWFSEVHVENNVLARNNHDLISPRYGLLEKAKAFDLKGCTGTIANNTIAGNTEGIHLEGSYPLVVNNIIASNASGLSWWGGYPGSSYDQPVVRRNCFSGNAVNYIGPSVDVSANVFADPRFANSSAGDYHILAASPCRDAGDSAAVTPGSTDLDGYARIAGPAVDMGAYELQDPAGVLIDLKGPVHTAPSVVDGIVYVSADDGKLYAFSTKTGVSASGFPVNVATGQRSGVKLRSRPAVYYGAGGKAIYLTTDHNDVVKVAADGSISWVTRPVPGYTNSTPAVTPDGSVYVSLGWTADPPDALNFLFRLHEARGTALYVSPYLGTSTPTSTTDRSPAVTGNYLYLNATGSTRGGLVIMDRYNLAIRAELGAGEDALPPFVSGPSLFLATRAGMLHKANSVTFTPDSAFASNGTLNLGEPASTSPFTDSAGTVYVGTARGTIWAVDPTTGAATRFFQSSNPDAITGLTVNRVSGVVSFGTASGQFFLVRINDPSQRAVFAPGGAVNAGPVFDATSGRFIYTTESGKLHMVPTL